MIRERTIGRTGLRTSELGMGCSRLGALLAAGGIAAAERAVETALDNGIRCFDTADIYGQGDSERILGRVLRSAGPDVTIATKAGHVLPARAWALRLAKPALRALLPLAPGLRRAVAQRRSDGFAQNFDTVQLRAALEGSLRRLRRNRVELFLLHNPPPALVVDDDLWEFVDGAKQAGDIGHFGVSCDGTSEDAAWLHRPAVEVVQIPWHTPDAAEREMFLESARRRGIGIIVREILGGPGAHDAASVDVALRPVLRRPDIAVALLGMTRADHVEDAVTAVRRIAAGAVRAAA